MRDRVPYPTTVDLIRAGNALQIEWDDGSETRYTGSELRWACPCAECQGEMGISGRLAGMHELPREELTLDQVGLIGQYALQISFKSGHGTGIYSFGLLHQLAERQRHGG